MTRTRRIASHHRAHLSAVVLVLALLLSNVARVTSSPSLRHVKSCIDRTTFELNKRWSNCYQQQGECPLHLHSSRHAKLSASFNVSCDGATKFRRERSDYIIATQLSSDQIADRVDCRLVREPPEDLFTDHQTAPLQHLNETAVLETHALDPPSYLDLERSGRGRTGVLVVHILLSSITFIILLPVATFVRAGGSSLYVLVKAATGIFGLVSLSLGVAYRASTPSMYDKSSHPITGGGAIVTAVGLVSFDLLCVIGPWKRSLVKIFLLYNRVYGGHTSVCCTSRCYEAQRSTSRHGSTPQSTAVDKHGGMTSSEEC